jgi:hypothetical protein
MNKRLLNLSAIVVVCLSLVTAIFLTFLTLHKAHADGCEQSTYESNVFILYPNQHINSLHSCTGPGWQLTYQNDGNLVLYQLDRPGQNWVHRWDSKTSGTCPGFAQMQEDGNFVVYDCSLRHVWDSETQGNPNDYMYLQSDGNLVIYNSGGKAIWYTNTQI